MGTADLSADDPVLLDAGPAYERWQGATGQLALRWSGRGGLEISVSGHGGSDLIELPTRRGDVVLRASGQLSLFFDLGEMPSYDSAMRVRWTEWVLQRKSSVNCLHVVARSKLVTMGVAVANLALDGLITSHTRREGTYVAALRAAGIDPHR